MGGHLQHVGRGRQQGQARLGGLAGGAILPLRGQKTSLFQME